MDKVILNTLSTEIVTKISEIISTDKLCYPLVRELEFKFGLKVFQVKRNAPNGALYYMCYPNGLPCGYASLERVRDSFNNAIKVGSDPEAWLFCFKCVYYQKARGSSDNDRRTIKSKKISSLMATLKKFDAIPPMEQITQSVAKKAGVRAKRRMISHYGDSNKSAVSVDTDLAHALVAKALGENPDKYGLSIDLNLCKIILDKFNQADTIRKIKKDNVERFFLNTFYAIQIDKWENFIVGKFRFEGSVKASDPDAFNVVTIEDFTRVNSLDHKQDLLPILTMLKVKNENLPNVTSLVAGLFPDNDKYDEDLDVINLARYTSDETDGSWMFIPCTQ